MLRRTSIVAGAILGLWVTGTILDAPMAHAQQPVRVETVKIADGVYIFRYGPSYQSMFVVAPGGVLVTDPINAAAAAAYMTEIRKITDAPIRYVVYSHHHYDHVMGGKVFKDAGATFVAHRNAKPPLERLKHPQIILPDQLVDDRTELILGETRVELRYVGRNHTDNSLVVFLPKEKIIFAVDFIAYREVPWRCMFDSYLDDWMDSLDRVLALDWERVIVGHSRLGGVGAKDDVRAQKQYMLDLKEAVRAEQGKCIDQAMKDIKLPAYQQWSNYTEFLPLNVERMCHYWRFGYQ